MSSRYFCYILQLKSCYLKWTCGVFQLQTVMKCKGQADQMGTVITHIMVLPFCYIKLKNKIHKLQIKWQVFPKNETVLLLMTNFHFSILVRLKIFQVISLLKEDCSVHSIYDQNLLVSDLGLTTCYFGRP